MLSVQGISAIPGLPASELVLGLGSSPAKPRVLLSSYLLNLWRGPEAVRDMIVADFCSATDMGASAHAADLLAVLRQFLDDFPEARVFSCACHQLG
ncbi:hypothetical protein MJC1_01907 [Methylocystis sp. MJC1]|nr:hypothetical protein MJC1_01907 [Methylocystis sp. MJC1]